MTKSDSIRYLNRRSVLLKDIAAIDDAIRRIVAGGVSSASWSGSAGSRSYTRLDIPALNAQRDIFLRELEDVTAHLAGRSSRRIRHVMTVRS